jgi:hypothetical protein
LFIKVRAYPVNFSYITQFLSFMPDSRTAELIKKSAIYIALPVLNQLKTIYLPTSQALNDMALQT